MFMPAQQVRVVQPSVFHFRIQLHDARPDPSIATELYNMQGTCFPKHHAGPWAGQLAFVSSAGRPDIIQSRPLAASLHESCFSLQRSSHETLSHLYSFNTPECVRERNASYVNPV